jgi:hypothetical protein
MRSSFQATSSEFSGGWVFARERRSEDLAFSDRERCAMLKPFCQVSEMGLEENLRLLRSQFYGLLLRSQG